MIRKSVNAVLVLAAVTVAILWCIACLAGTSWSWHYYEKGELYGAIWVATDATISLCVSLNPHEVRWIHLPGSLVLLLLALYPTITFVRGPLRRYRRREKGCCLKCGYNLTGNVSGVCPECGEPAGQNDRHSM